jgi:undecaprenyl-diphosphatase
MHNPDVLAGGWNITLFLQMHATVDSPHGLIAVASWLAVAPLFAAFALSAWRLFRRRDVPAVTRMVIAFAIAFGIEAVISQVAFHPRPLAAGFGPAFVAHAANNSMPSTHVTLALIMAITFALRRDLWTSAALFVLAILMAWARVYVGIHWPADMLGAVISACVSVVVASGLCRLARSVLAGRRNRGETKRYHGIDDAG